MSDIKESIHKLEKTILEDGKVDRAEAVILLAYAKERAEKSAEMAEFVKALEDVLEDGVVTPEESVRIGAHLKWLTREAESEEPETTFLGRVFKLKRNRTTVKVEVAETANYLSGSATSPFAIAERGKVTIIWVVDNVETSVQVDYESVPSYAGSTEKASDGKYTYEFVGWNDGTTTWTGTLPPATEETTYTAVYTTGFAVRLALPLADHAVDATVNGLAATVAIAPTGTIEGVTYTAAPAAAWSDATTSFAFEGLDWNAGTNWTVDAAQGADALAETAHNEGVFYAKASTELFTATTSDFVEFSDMGVAGVGYSNEVASAAGEAVRVHTTIDVPDGGLTDEPDVGDAKAGFAVLRAEMYGHGMSGGSFRDHTIYKWVGNAMAVIDYTRQLDFVTDLYLCGHSQGGLLVMLVAAMEHDRLKAILPLSPAICIPSDARSGNVLGVSFDPDHIPEVLDCGDGDILGGNHVRVAQMIDVDAAIRRYTGPVLLVHGTGDETVPFQYSVDAAGKYADAKLVLIPDDTHCYDLHLDLVEAAVRDFLLEVSAGDHHK